MREPALIVDAAAAAGRASGMTPDGPDGWGAPLHARVLDLADVGSGCKLLDLGCGPGVFARAAVERGALVTGVDVNPALVAVAGRAVPEAQFHVGTAEQPPHGPFDVVTGVQVLQHVASPLAVLRAACAVGGTVVVTVWGRADECDIGLIGAALGRWLPPQPARPGPPPVTDPEGLRALAVAAGLDVVGVDEVICPFTYADDDELVGPLFHTGVGRAAMNRAGPDAVRGAVLERLRDRRRPDGSYVLQNLFRVLHARPGCGPAMA